jgi:hypothetical protein
MTFQVGTGLHEIVNDVLMPLNNPPNCEVIFAPECGGSHRLPLFSRDQKGRAFHYCDVDGLILFENVVRVIIEIEDSQFRPINLIGKFGASSLCRSFIHRSKHNMPIAIRVATFIQVVNTGNLNDGTNKPMQYENLETDMRKLLEMTDGRITAYKLFHGNVSDFSPAGQKRQPLFDLVKRLTCRN